MDYARKLKVVTPRYRKHIVYKGKDYSKPAETAKTQEVAND
jgi:hypothetical protein